MTAMLQVRMDEDTKADALAVLDALGLTASDAVRLLFRRIIADQAFPLELKAPNTDTRAAMEESRGIIAAHRKRERSRREDTVDTPLAPDRRLEPKGPNAETLAAMREAEEIMAAHRRGWESEDRSRT
jgi:DNA-damage-inducible protein J